MTGYTGWALWAFVAGAGIPVMASLNGSLARTLDSTPAAAVTLFAVGLLAATAVLVASGTWPGIAAFAKAPPQLFAGGLIVAFYILGVTFLAPRFGVANTILFVMVAQIVTSSLIDHFGILGATQRPLQPLRMAGLAILMLGLAVTQLSRAGD
jgi:bacterial/archaeal transporter family-2 protein